MAERKHEPKLAALGAFAAGALSARARARVQRHLAGCAECAAALAGMNRYTALRKEARAEPIPELEWSRVEQAVLDRVARGALVRRIGSVTLALVLAAAAVALWQRPAPPPPLQQHATVPAPSPPTAEPRLVAARVAAIVGRARIAREGADVVDLAIDAVVPEGARIETEADSEVHLWLDGTASLLIGADSRVALARLREAEIELELQQGQVINAVRPLGAGSYGVAALGHRVVVRGTHFAVVRAGESISVQVDLGAVAVLRGDTVVTELRAPQRWSSSVEPQGASSSSSSKALRKPHPWQAGSPAWPVLEVPSWPRVVAWDIGGTELPAGLELRMRAPVGELTIGALLADGRRMVASIVIDALGARFDPRALRFVGSRPGPDPGRELDPSEAAAVIRAGQAGLQRCYERSLRNQPAGALRARLQLELDAGGAVRRARLRSAAPLPPLLRDCVQRVASAWRFPEPGGAGITFEAPLSFQPR